MEHAVRMMRSWTGTYRVVGVDTESLSALGRVIALALLAIGLCYLGGVAWGVLQELRAVKLQEFREILRIVSVGDALLMAFGYVVVRDLIRAIGRRRPY
jgi:hypothetical protein